MKNFALTDKIAVSPRAAARTRKLAGKGIQGIVKAVFLLGFCFVILYPILMMVSKAFMERGDIFDNTVILIPRNFTLQNFDIAHAADQLLGNPGQYPAARGLGDSSGDGVLPDRRLRTRPF